MLESQFPGMQHLSRKGLRESATINFIAEDRVAQMMKVHTELVRAAAVQFAFNQTHLV
jgi:hypothetical protein